MKRVKWTGMLGSLLLLASLGGVAELAAAKYITQNLGLKHANTDCDGYRTFGYVASWQAPANSTSFQVHTANRCQVGPINCSAGGQCTARLSACVTGPSWVQVGAILAPPSKDILIQRVAVPWPTDASGKKKVCS
jgi:hypothetical protein